MNIKKLNRLDEYLNRGFEQKKISGCSLVVEHNGKRVYDKFFGADRKDSIYKIFSMTKPVTAVAAMELYEKGELDIMSRVQDYLPGFESCNVAGTEGIHIAENPIRICDLLNMTSGIVMPGEYGIAEQSMAKTYREARIQGKSGILKSAADVANKLGEACLAFEPGTGYKAGLSADVLGAVLEVITHERLSDFLQSNLFSYINMVDTDFHIDGNKTFRQAVLYRHNRNGKAVRAEDDVAQKLDMFEPFREPWYESAGSGLYSTMEDYVHFCEMLFNKGSFHGKDILGHKTMEFMVSDQLVRLSREAKAASLTRGFGYGNYFDILLDPAAACRSGSIGEYGCNGDQGCFFYIDPSEDLIVIFMQQIDGGCEKSFIRGIMQIVYGAM